MAVARRDHRPGRRAARPDRSTTTSATTRSTSPRSPTPSRRAGPRAARARGASTPSSSRPTRRRSRSAARRRRTFAPVAHRVPMMSLDNAFSVDGAARRGATRLERGWHRRRRRRLRVRAEDRRPRHLAALRGRAARAGRRPGATAASARTSPPTSRTIDAIPKTLDGQRRPRRARGAGRGLHAARRVRGAQRAPGRGRRSRSSPTRATRRPARCARRTRRSPPVARAVVLDATSSARSRAARRSRATTRRSTACATLGFPVNPEIQRARHARRGLRLLPRTGRSTATTSTTRSTASS